VLLTDKFLIHNWVLNYINFSSTNTDVLKPDIITKTNRLDFMIREDDLEYSIELPCGVRLRILPRLVVLTRFYHSSDNVFSSDYYRSARRHYMSITIACNGGSFKRCTYPDNLTDRYLDMFDSKYQFTKVSEGGSSSCKIEEDTLDSTKVDSSECIILTDSSDQIISTDQNIPEDSSDQIHLVRCIR
jgi:hypothetical protein